MSGRTPEQDELAQTVRRLLDRRSDSAAVRRAVETAVGYDADLWQTMCEQIGICALAVPEDHDGVGATFAETGLVLEELGRNLAPAPLLTTSIATATLLLHGPDSLASQILPLVATGQVTALRGLPAPDLVLDGAAAAMVLGFAGGRPELLTDPVAEIAAMDPGLRLARTQPGETPPPDVLAAARALVACVQAGVAARGLEMTVAYSKERVQFGRPIGSFQALKHRMADMLVAVETSRSVARSAVVALAEHVAARTEQTSSALLRQSAVAASWCSESLGTVATETIQLHGGIAITWEHDAHLVLKRAHALDQLAGPAHRARQGLVSLS